MKEYFIITLILVIPHIGIGQEIYLEKGKKLENTIDGAYYRIPTDIFEKYTGVWEGTQNNDAFQIKIYTEKVQFENVYMEMFRAKFCQFDSGKCEFQTGRYISGIKIPKIIDDGIIKFPYGNYKTRKFAVLIVEIQDNGMALVYRDNPEVDLIFGEMETIFPKTISMKKLE
ncbi:hypothetical protein [Winogradskyella aurantiaca]|uniref:hypothetical protein n=1 Tax=Winogradskyella aurantiaca TaxID=2219558 RepID=UPI000E1CD501|nr:hypothetical protein [Winogradskyella aurantiaca]